MLFLILYCSITFATISKVTIEWDAKHFDEHVMPRKRKVDSSGSHEAFRPKSATATNGRRELLMWEGDDILWSESCQTEFHVPSDEFDGERRIVIPEYDPSGAVLVSFLGQTSNGDPVGFGVPDQLVRLFAETENLIVLLSPSLTAESIGYLSDALNRIGVALEDIEVVPVRLNSWWVRDYGPFYTKTADNTARVANHIYDHTLRGCRYRDNFAPRAFGEYLGVPVDDLPLVQTGGNMMFTDTHLMSFDDVYESNADYNNGLNLTREETYDAMQTWYGIEEFYTPPDPLFTEINHIDTFAKSISDDVIIMARVPKSHPEYEHIERTYENVKTWGKTVKFIDVAKYINGVMYSGFYMNSLILNNRVYVPLMEANEDTEILNNLALSQYEEYMGPDYEIIGIYPKLEGSAQGWTYQWLISDALHCRSKEVAKLLMDQRTIDCSHCEKTYDLVCGSSNTTYASACQAECFGEEVSYEGECVLEEVDDQWECERFDAENCPRVRCILEGEECQSVMSTEGCTCMHTWFSENVFCDTVCCPYNGTNACMCEGTNEMQECDSLYEFVPPEGCTCLGDYWNQCAIATWLTSAPWCYSNGTCHQHTYNGPGISSYAECELQSTEVKESAALFPTCGSHDDCSNVGFCSWTCWYGQCETYNDCASEDCLQEPVCQPCSECWSDNDGFDSTCSELCWGPPEDETTEFPEWSEMVPLYDPIEKVGTWNCSMGTGCSWQEFEEGVAYGFYDTSEGDCDLCGQMCLEDPDCAAFECDPFTEYCSWWKSGYCDQSVQEAFLGWEGNTCYMDFTQVLCSPGMVYDAYATFYDEMGVAKRCGDENLRCQNEECADAPSFFDQTYCCNRQRPTSFPTVTPTEFPISISINLFHHTCLQ